MVKLMVLSVLSSVCVAAAATAVQQPEAPEVEPATMRELLDGDYFKRQDDGSLLVADEWTVTGAGTPGEPFVVDWAMLAAASDDYSPQLGKHELPRWTRLLQGRHVRLKGYIAFPFMATEADELLLMLNEWDGCCLGVPPTPYDAVEVTLRDTVRVTGGHMMFNTGEVTGIFRTEPYVMDKWLLGIWVIERARVDTVIVEER